MKRRALATVLAVTLSLQGSMQTIASSEWTESFSEQEVSIETETDKDVGFSETEEGKESPESPEPANAGAVEEGTDEREAERTWVLDEDNLTFTAGTPTVEFVERTEEDTIENTETKDGADFWEGDEFVVDVEEFNDQEGELQSELESETEQVQPESTYRNISDDSAVLSLSVTDAWVVRGTEENPTEERTIVSVEDNQLIFTGFSASSIKELGYSLCLDYSAAEDTGLKAGDELLVSLPSQYLDYGEVMPDVFEMENTAGQRIHAGTFELADNEVRIVFGEEVESADFAGGQGYIELQAKLKYDALFCGMQAKETLVLPETAGDCVVQASSEIALILPPQDLANGIEQTCEYDEVNRAYIWSVTAGTLTPGVLMADYSLEDVFDTDKWCVASVEAEGESLFFETTEEGIRFCFPESSVAPYTVHVSMQLKSTAASAENMETKSESGTELRQETESLPETELSTEQEENCSDTEAGSAEDAREICTNTVRLTHAWIGKNMETQWESTETFTRMKGDMETETEESEIMAEESAAIKTIAEETAEESAVIPPLGDWGYQLSLSKNNKTGEIKKAVVYLYYYGGEAEAISIPETYTVDGISYDVTFSADYIDYFIDLYGSVFNRRVRKVIFPEKDILHNGSMEFFFRDCANLEEIVNLDKQTAYDIFHTFEGCTSLVTAPRLPMSVRNMGMAFSGCTSLLNAPEIPPSVTDMQKTFWGCEMLEEAPEIPPSVRNMDGTFNGCKMLREAPEIPSLVTDMDNTFSSCTSLVSAPVIPKSVTNMEGTFYECESLINAPEIPPLVRSLAQTFSGCVSLEKVPDLPGSVTDMSYTFDRCSALVNAPKLSASVTNMNYTFEGCISLAYAPEIPVSVTNMEGTFYGCTSLINAPELPACVTDMGYTFYNCASLADAPELPASVTDIRSAFSGCNSLENAPEIPHSVTNMAGVFRGCNSLKKAPEIPSSVTDIRHAFNGCASLTSAPEIPLSVTDMGYAFSGCRLLEKAPRIPTSVTNMEHTFAGCSLLVNAPKIPSSVTNMVETFEGCTSLVKAPDIPDSVMNMRSIFIGCRNLQGNMTIYTALEDAAYHWKNAFSTAAINDTGLVVNYCEENAHVIDDIIASKVSSRSNIVKGQCVEKPISSVTETGEYLLRITDTAGEALADVEVVYGMLDALHTNKRGEVTLRFTEAELAGADRLEDAAEDAKKQMHTLRLKKEGYQEQVRENYLFDEENTAPVIRLLKTGEEALSSAVLSYEKTQYDILDHDASVDVSGAIFGTSKTFSLQFVTEKQGTDQYEFAIRQGKKTVARSGKNGTFELSCAAFAAGEDVYLDFIDKATNTIVKSEKLRLHFIDSRRLPSKIELGSSFKIHVDDNIPLLGGKDFSLSSLNFPLDFSVDGNGKVRVGVNIELDKSKCGFVSGDPAVVEKEKEWSGRTAFSKTLGKLLNGEASNVDFDNLRDRLKQKDKHAGSGAVSISVNFGGYLEGSMSDLFDSYGENDLSVFKNLKGSLFGEVKVKVSSETGFAVAFIPCVCAIDGSGSFKTSVKWDHGMDITMEPSAGLTLYCGAGWPSVVSGGFYGDGNLKADFLLSTFKRKEKNGPKKVTLSGSAGFMGRVLGKELLRVSLIDGTYDIYREGGVSQTSLDNSYTSTLQEQVALAISDTDTDIVEEMDRDYLSKRSEWKGMVSDAVNEVQVLQASTYMDIQPTILSTVNGKVMVWLDDLGDIRDSANRTAVVYSVFDETASAWSKPQALEDDGTADFSPAVCSDGEDIYVIWQDAKEELASDMTIADQSALLELNTARIDVADKKCMLLGVITDNDEYEMEPVLTVDDGTLTARWYVNSEKNPLGAAGENIFYSAAYRDGIWTQAQATVTGGLILTKAVGSLNGVHYTATGEDADMDLTTTEDRRLYLCADNSRERTEVSSGITSKVHAALIHGEDAFCWAEGGSIKYITSQNGAVQTLLEDSLASGCDYQIFGDSAGNMSLVYFVVQDARTKVMVQSYDPAGKTWGQPITLVDNGKYIERVSGYYENGRLTLAFSQTDITDIESLKTITDFCYMVLDGHANLEVTEVDYDASTVKPGSDVELTLKVKNTASEAASDVSAEILDENGTVAAAVSLNQSLAGGGTAELRCTLTLPEEKGAYRYAARTGTNTYEFTIGQGELLVIAKNESYTASNRLAVHIRNIGLGATGGMLELYNYENEDEVYLTEMIPELKGGGTYLFSCKESSLYTVTGEPHTIGVRVRYDGGENTDFVIMDSGIYTVTFEQGFYGNYEKTEVKASRGTVLTMPVIADVLGWYVDEELTMKWDFAAPVSGDMTLYAKWDRCETHEFERQVIAPTCTERGYTLYDCVNCNYWYKDDFVDMVEHTWGSFIQDATCADEGERSTKCTVCGKVLEAEKIPRKEHTAGTGEIAIQPGCEAEGMETVSCTVCGAVLETKKILPKGHTWSDWIKTADATVLSDATETRVCSSCGQKEERKIGGKLSPILKLTAKNLKMQTKQSTKKFKVEEMAAGDSIRSVVSSNKKILKVSSMNKKKGTFKLKAQGRKGTAKLKITLTSGASKTVKVKVQTAKVVTGKLKVRSKKITLQRGKTLKLKPVVTPVTSQDKITYSSSDKKVATVSPKGVIKAVGKGNAKITVRSGKKKVICTVIIR